MKTKFVFPITGVIAILMFLGSCGSEQQYFPDVESVSGANVKFIHAASDASGVYFYINDARISSGANPNTTTTYAFSFPTINYVSINASSQSLKIAVPATSTAPENVLVTGTLAPELNKSYSVALAGISGSYEAVLINDDFSSVAFDGNSYVRFINLIHNSANKVNVVATLGTDPPITLASNVAYKESVAFTLLKPGDYTIQLKDAVTSSVIASASTANKLLSANRSYTFFARGQIGQTGTKAPTLDRMINQ